MSESIVLSLILTVSTLIGVLMVPALQGDGAPKAPPRARRSLFPQFTFRLIGELVRVFGSEVQRPPPKVMRAFHRGEHLVVLTSDEGGGRLTWTA